MSILRLLGKLFGDDKTASFEGLNEVGTAIQDREPIHVPKVTAEQVHREFHEEIHRITEYASVKHDVSNVIDVELKERADKLDSLGFRKQELFEESSKQHKIHIELVAENTKRDMIIKMIQYFTEKYPMYRFITFDSIQDLCNKYGLVYLPARYFKEEIPEQNIQDLMKFEVEPIDRAVLSKYKKHEMDFEDFVWDDEEGNRHRIYASKTGEYECTSEDGYGGSDTSNCPYAEAIVVAEESMFDLPRNIKIDYLTDKNGRRIQSLVKDDPIVIMPVRMVREDNGHMYQHVGGLIITAWGEEAKDIRVIK